MTLMNVIVQYNMETVLLEMDPTSWKNPIHLLLQKTKYFCA